MEKIVVFNDFANTESAFAARGATPDYADLLDYLSEDRFLVEAHAYVPIDPRNPDGRKRTIESLWQQRWMVHSKVGAFAGETYKCDFDVSVTIDLMRTAEIVRPDIVVLLSGDKDFVPVILELRRRGIRVEVAGFARGNAAHEVILKANGFIDLDRYLEERSSVPSTGDSDAWPDEEPEDDVGIPAAAADVHGSDQADIPSPHQIRR
jgi:uncharacterized LabA/DUF88 family protein